MLFPRRLCYSFACLCLVVSSLAILSVKAEDGPQTDLIFFQDFENGFDAAWSNGSGRALYSHNLSLVEGLVAKIKEELKLDLVVVATGGLAKVVDRETGVIDDVDEFLTLQGLKYLYDLNSISK